MQQVTIVQLLVYWLEYTNRECTLIFEMARRWSYEGAIQAPILMGIWALCLLLSSLGATSITEQFQAFCQDIFSYCLPSREKLAFKVKLLNKSKEREYHCKKKIRLSLKPKSKEVPKLRFNQSTETAFVFPAKPSLVWFAPSNIKWIFSSDKRISKEYIYFWNLNSCIK